MGTGEAKTVGPNRLVITHELYVPPGFGCKPFDRVRGFGWQFEVFDWPQDFGTGPFAFTPGLVVHLRRVEG
ncbi:hypothetical protein D5S18_03000 [Nocardia panacis]|uniref:Uncharacterized protein n=1 Tax=Nocardia panacis TaxID=2340916 RepID=A0A3A4KZD2_9NOCA|nr:hypothetical protein [Nocardia panacis]RJO79314.1 hypothetical protein D5S18_03000 [Nocardia panacis]